MLLNDLDAHAWCYEESHNPFEDLGSAVTRYRGGDLLPVFGTQSRRRHRTWELGEIVYRFVSPKDVTEKKL